jgi:DNA helicase II / ATP-dependent DNA helicase PcrA
MELDDTRRAILDADGHLLVEGGPGSGKTTVALLKAARMLDTLEPEQRVVFLSFSRAAVRQISDRVGEHLPRTGRNHLEIRTFHAFFMDFVRAHGPLLTGMPAVFLPPDAENPRKADYDGDWEAETRELARRSIYVFDQLAPVTATLLERSPALRRLYSDRYPLVIVDEFQDTNLDQWRVIQALAQDSTVMMLADPDQRIFEFIPGVDETRLQQAAEALAPERFDLAGDNHRSAGNGILDYANAVLRGQPASRPGTVLDLRYGYPSTPEQVAHKVIPLVQAQLAEQLGGLPTVAVLALSNTLAAVVSEEMSEDRQALDGRTLPAIDHKLVWEIPTCPRPRDSSSRAFSNGGSGPHRRNHRDAA